MEIQVDKTFFFHVPMTKETETALYVFSLLLARAAKALAADYTRIEKQRKAAITPRNIFQELYEDISQGAAKKHFEGAKRKSWIGINPKTQAAFCLLTFMDQMQTIEHDGKIYKSWPMLLKFIETIENDNGIDGSEADKTDK